MYDDIAAEFEQHRPKMNAVARRLLTSDADADDAVQEAWVRLQRTDRASIDNLEAWLMTTVGRIGLNLLRSRSTRREMPLDQIAESNDPLHQPDPAIDVLLAETVGSALQIVIDTMTPAERVAYLLHDAFGFPYSEIGRVLNRTPEAARALASRGRGRIRHTDPGHIESAMPATEQSVVDAFLTAANGGDVAALVDLLDPQIVERIAIAGQPVVEIRGAESVAGRAREFSSNYTDARSALINGWPGWIAYRDGAVYSVGALAISDGRIVRMDVVLDPARLTDFRIAAPS